jgi:hypothetical protein
MEKMQTFIDFIFYAVWCQAPLKRPYRLELFASNPELFEVMTAFHYDDSKGAEFFAGHVERIYGLFAPLSSCQVEQLRLWYRANNDVEGVCANDHAMSLKRYADFPAELNELRDQLKSFFTRLYSNVGISVLKRCVGDIDDHYKTFVQINKEGKCPFCGLSDLLGPNHIPREAYDHYLPKALYPFNSINFRNLVPACHHCNSSYKTSKDPAYTPKDPARAVQRRAVFYPYKTEPHSVELQIDLQHSDIPKLTHADITLRFGPAAITQEIDTWKDVYGIEERYKSKLCTESDGKSWLAQVLDEWKELGRDPRDYLRALALNTQRRPYSDCNFLRAPFLDACRRRGIFDEEQAA